MEKGPGFLESSLEVSAICRASMKLKGSRRCRTSLLYSNTRRKLIIDLCSTKYGWWGIHCSSQVVETGLMIGSIREFGDSFGWGTWCRFNWMARWIFSGYSSCSSSRQLICKLIIEGRKVTEERNVKWTRYNWKASKTTRYPRQSKTGLWNRTSYKSETKHDDVANDSLICYSTRRRLKFVN